MGWDSSNTNTLITAGADTLSGFWGLIGEKDRENRAFDKNKALMDIQFKNQQALNKQGQELQLDTWKQTNYPAQVAMLKEAGLNPGLMYGQAGAGGTTGSQGGGSASMGSAQQGQPHRYFDLANTLRTGAELSTIKAKARLDNAQAKVLEETGIQEAETRISKMVREATNEQLKGRLIMLEADMLEIEKAQRPYKLKAEIDNIMENMRGLKIHNDLTEEQFNDLVKETRERAIGQALNNTLTEVETELKKHQINLTDTQKQQINISLAQKWTELGLEGRKLDQEAERIAIQQFEAELKANYPTTGQVAGSIAKKAYITLKNLELLITGKETIPITDSNK